MMVNNFEEFRRHLDHKIICVRCGDPISWGSLIHEDCSEVLQNYDKDAELKIKYPS